MTSSDAKHIQMTFLQVKSDKEKRDQLVAKAMEYFEKKIPLLFRLQSQHTLDYLDLLLWRYPPDSFLPHTTQSGSCNTLIALTKEEHANPNSAHTIFNLSPNPVDNPDNFFTQIYEFEDLSSPEKNHIAQKHYHFYKKKGFTIIHLDNTG